MKQLGGVADWQRHCSQWHCRSSIPARLPAAVSNKRITVKWDTATARDDRLTPNYASGFGQVPSHA